MNIYKHFTYVVRSSIDELVAEGKLPVGLDTSRIVVEAPRDSSHGDFANNAAMVLAKQVGAKPRDLAEILLQVQTTKFGAVSGEIAGPGFINHRMPNEFWYERLRDVLRAGPSYGESDEGQGKRV